MPEILSSVYQNFILLNFIQSSQYWKYIPEMIYLQKRLDEL